MVNLLLKKNVESIFAEFFDKQIIVEFVPDVLARQKGICKEDSKSYSKVYSAKRFTGMFIPESDNHCTYILAEEGRNECDTVITVNHELRHAIDYNLFLSLFDNNQDNMLNANIYYTFQIYSEFMAEQFGIKMFFDLCYQDKSKQEKIKMILDAYVPVYEDFSNVHDKYEYIIHSVQYLGILYACVTYDSGFNLERYISEMCGLKELEEIILSLLGCHSCDIEWFKKFDKICRDAMQISN